MDIGIEIYKVYFVADKFYYKHNESISLNKVHVLIEHLIGLKIEKGKFKPFKQDWFKDVYFYDDEKMNIDYANDVQLLLERILKSTDDELFKMVLDKLNENEITLHNNLITNNDVNLFNTTRIKIETPSSFPIKMTDEHIKKFNRFINGSSR